MTQPEGVTLSCPSTGTLVPCAAHGTTSPPALLAGRKRYSLFQPTSFHASRDRQEGCKCHQLEKMQQLKSGRPQGQDKARGPSAQSLGGTPDHRGKRVSYILSIQF